MNRNSPRIRTVRLSLLALAVGGGIAALAFAGPLDPPAGPVAPTYKALSEVEPRIAINAANTPGTATALFRITQPGSYYLTGNITGVAAKHGIEIAASGVTLDLMGFDLSGVAGSLDGVSAAVNDPTNITIRNGSVRGWGDEGVDLGTFALDNSAVIDVRASGNMGNGISAYSGCTITGCTVYQNTASGILTNSGCTITGCTASENTGDGISAGFGCTITGCTALFNRANGIAAGFGCTITGCTAYGSFGSGILTNSGCTVTGCMGFNSDASGIVTGSDCTISGCMASSNTGRGISTASRCIVTGCTAASNVLDGISLSSDSSVSGCNASSNSGDGIEVTSGCTVTNNTCNGNGTASTLGAGVRVTSTGCVVDGNTLDLNRLGITVPGTGALIVRNRCRGNVNFNYDIGINNHYGPIINITAGGTAFAAGNSAPSTLGSTDPNANFAY